MGGVSSCFKGLLQAVDHFSASGFKACQVRKPRFVDWPALDAA